MALRMNVSRWTMPVAALALLAGLGIGTVRADDAPTTAPAGKAMITVKVVDGDGKAVSGARVSLYPAMPKKAAPTAAVGSHAQPMSTDDPAPAAPPAGKKARPKALQTATTDADGQAMLKDVADGSYTVRANLKGTGRGTGTVTIADGKDATVSITLK